MSFSIQEEADKYLPERYPKASKQEWAKWKADWVGKDPAAAGIVRDFEKRVFKVEGKRILDAGCGIGGVSIAFTRAGANVSGVEVQPELHDIAVRNAKDHGVSPELILYSGEVLPFNNGEFDVAISVSVLEHTTDPVNYLREIFRTIKSGGVLYLAYPNKLWPKETHTGLYFLSYLPRRCADMYISLFGKNPIDDNWLHFYTYWDLLKILNKAVGKDNFFVIQENGESKSFVSSIIKKIIKVLGFPTHRVFLPHISVLVKKK